MASFRCAAGSRDRGLPGGPAHAVAWLGLLTVADVVVYEPFPAGTVPEGWPQTYVSEASYRALEKVLAAAIRRLEADRST